MIRRYNLSHPAGQPMPEDWIHLPYSVVAAADYDALTARLAEAEATASTANHGHELCYKALLSAEARLAEAETALQRLIEAADDSDGCQYGTLITYFVRQQCRHGLRLTDSAADATVDENCRFREALNIIASWDEGAEVSSRFDEPGSAKLAREVLAKGAP